MLLARTHLSLTGSEQALLADVVERELPEHRHRLQQPYAVDRLEQPWFRRHNILDVQFVSPPVARLYVALSLDPEDDDESRMSVLTGYLPHLHELAAIDPPLGLDLESLAAGYAAYGNEWTRGHQLGEMQLADFDAIPWLRPLTPQQQMRVEVLRLKFASQLHPERRLRTAAGWSFRSWWLAAQTLLERELVVPVDGAMTRTDLVQATELPVPLGTTWDVVEGRLVPTS